MSWLTCAPSWVDESPRVFKEDGIPGMRSISNREVLPFKKVFF